MLLSPWLVADSQSTQSVVVGCFVDLGMIDEGCPLMTFLIVILCALGTSLLEGGCLPQ